MDIVFFAISLAMGGYFTGNGLRVLFARQLSVKRQDSEPLVLIGQPAFRIGILHTSVGLIFVLLGLQIAGVINLFPTAIGRSVFILLGLVLYVYSNMYIANLRDAP